MSFFGDLFGGDAAKEAAEQNKANLASLKSEGLGYLDTGKAGALGSLNSAISAYSPVSALGKKYSGAGDMLLNALGLNGASGNAAATAAFRSSPGYDYTVNQALDALDRRAASRGLLGSGNNTIDTLSTVHGLADQDYENYLNRLSSLAALGANETNVGSAGAATGYTNMAPVYTNDANARVSLASGVTNGINNQNTQAANAEMQGGANLLNFGLNLGKLALAVPTGGTSLLGGLGGLGGIGGTAGNIGGTGGNLGGLY